MQDVGEVIERRRNEILDQWTRGAGLATYAKGLSPPQLLGGMGAFLDSLAIAERVGVSEPESMARQERVIERHLSQRLRLGAGLNEILTEIISLVGCVSRAVIADGIGAGEAASPTRMVRLSRSLRLAVGASQRIFSEHLLEDEQQLKLHALALQRIVADLDFAAPLPLSERMTAAVETVMAAMGAQTAALLLRDQPGGRLLVCASAGQAHEQLGRWVGEQDSTTLGGAIAADPEGATTVGDASTTGLEVSEALRRSGIHSLLGVALSFRHVLRGVVYVGTTETRGFSASEERRLEALGEALVVPLESARLSSLLRERGLREASEADERRALVDTLAHDISGAIAAAKRAVHRLCEARGSEALAGAAAALASLDRVEEKASGLIAAHHPLHGDPARGAPGAGARSR